MRRAVASSQYSVVDSRKTESRELSEVNVKLEVRNRMDEAKGGKQKVESRRQKAASGITTRLASYWLLTTVYCLLLSAFCLPALGQQKSAQAGQQTTTTTTAPSPASIQSVEATQAALGKEIDGNGL